MANLSLDRRSGEVARNQPVQRPGFKTATQEPTVILTLHDNQHVALQVLVCDVPGLDSCTLATADAEALSLTERVVHQALVTAEHDALECFDRAGLRWEVSAQEFGEWPFPDEADS